MKTQDLEKLLEDLLSEIAQGARSFCILGIGPATFRLIDMCHSMGLLRLLNGVYALDPPPLTLHSVVPVLPFAALATQPADVLIVGVDAEKEDILLAALPHIVGAPRVLVAGYGHLAFRDAVYSEEVAQLLVPSLANGYPESLPHLYQCLVNAHRLQLSGSVAEFGMFKGGTTMFLSRVIERLGAPWPILGFDSFSGFPPRRSALDMYDHPDCVFTDLASVRRYLSGRNIEIVEGDVVDTAARLERENLVLTFIDTDNYSSAKAALSVVQERTVVGGCIVFDHFTGVDRFRYTVGERIAGLALLHDSRYFHLHATGVFYRQR